LSGPGIQFSRHPYFLANLLISAIFGVSKNPPPRPGLLADIALGLKFYNYF